MFNTDTDDDSETETETETETRLERRKLRPVRPDQIPHGNSPARVEVLEPAANEGERVRTVHVATYRTKENGWVYTSGWDGERTLYPPDRVVSITPIETGYLVTDENGGFPPHKTVTRRSDFRLAARKYRQGVRHAEEEYDEKLRDMGEELDEFDADHGRGEREDEDDV